MAIELRWISNKELQEILSNHKRYLNGEGKEFKADLSYAEIENVNLQDAILANSKTRFTKITLPNTPCGEWLLQQIFANNVWE